jgi:hypothetical protein
VKRPRNLHQLAAEDATTLTELRVAALADPHPDTDNRLAAWLAAANYYGYTMQALGDTIGVTRARVQQIIATAPALVEVPPVVGIYRELQPPPDPPTRWLELAARAGRTDILDQPRTPERWVRRTGHDRTWHHLSDPQRTLLTHVHLKTQRQHLMKHTITIARALHGRRLLQPGEGWRLTEAGHQLCVWAEDHGHITRPAPPPPPPPPPPHAEYNPDGTLDSGVYEINRDGTLGRRLVES